MRTLFDDFQEMSPDRAAAWTSNLQNSSTPFISATLVLIFVLIFTQSILSAVFVSILVFFGVVQAVRTSIARKKICEKNDWVSGICTSSSQSTLRSRFKTLPIGTPAVDEEVVGKIKDETFYMGRFSATTGSGKSRRTERVNILLFKLEREIPLKFSIVKEGFFSSKDDIQVESIDFNEKFKIQYDANQKQQIMHLLTPSLQTLLLDINKIFKIHSVEVVENVLLFSYSANLFSSYGLTTRVSESQIAKIEEKILKLLSFADEVSDIFDRK